VKCIVVGDCFVGKTSLISAYVTRIFSKQYQATIGVNFLAKVMTWDTRTVVTIQLWDIAGMDRSATITRVYFDKATAALVVCDVSQEKTFHGAILWKKDIDQKVMHPDTGEKIPVILCANKIDLLENEVERQKMRSFIDEFSQSNGFYAWFETSAKNIYGIDDATRCLVRRVIETIPEETDAVPSEEEPLVLMAPSTTDQGQKISDCRC